MKSLKTIFGVVDLGLVLYSAITALALIPAEYQLPANHAKQTAAQKNT